MIVSAHQPNFIPWLGFFYKIAISDIFVFADDYDYTQYSFINRNRIKTSTGTIWMTVPVINMPLGTPINKIEIVSMFGIKKIIKSVRLNYAKAPYYKPFFEKFESTILSSGKNLSAINIKLIKLINRELNIYTPIFKTSELKGIGGSATEKIISICKAFNADTYISGFGGENYQLKELIESNGIKCQIYKFKHPEYKQLWGAFEPNMSIIDLIFNHGPKAEKILKSI